MKLLEFLTPSVSLRLLTEALGNLFELDTSPEAEQRFEQQADALSRLFSKIDRGKFHELQDHPVIRLYASKGIKTQGDVRRALTTNIQGFRAQASEIRKEREQEGRTRDQQKFYNTLGQKQDDLAQSKKQKELDAAERQADAERKQERNKELYAGDTAGYWLMAEMGSKRVWKVQFGSPTGIKDALFPFKNHNQNTSDVTGVDQYQAFEALPGRTRESLKGEEKQLFMGLEDALKDRSSVDTIPNQDFNLLLDQCAETLMHKTGADNAPGQSIFILTPPSSSGVVKQFAATIQKRLGVPNENMLFDYFKKRSAKEFFNEFQNSPKISQADKRGAAERMKRHYDKAGWDAPMQIKYLWQGDRNAARNAEVFTFDLVKKFENLPDSVPYLIIVDDNTQSGATQRELAYQFGVWAERQPEKVWGMSMFKYK